MPTNHFRRHLASRELSVGTFVLEFATDGIVALTEGAGADWVLIDTEHTGWSTDRVRGVLAGARSTQIARFVRVAGHQQHLVSTALDAGAEGIMVPFVDTAEQARAIVSWMKYPPVGVRGSAFTIGHDAYAPGHPRDKGPAANAATVFLPQIESAAGVEQADAIAAVEGVDVMFVGPLDLSTSLGAPGDTRSPAFVAALEKVAAGARSHGKACGLLSTSDALTQVAIDLGYTVIAHSGDLWIYQDGFRQSAERIRGFAR